MGNQFRIQKLIEQISKGWFLIVFIISMVLWYADTNSKLNTVFAQQAEQQEQIDKIIIILETTNQLKIDVAVIKNDVATIKNNLK